VYDNAKNIGRAKGGVNAFKGVFSHKNTTNSKIFNGANKTPRRGQI